MVNLDKWEEVEFFDVKPGDTVKTVHTHADGTVAIRKGKIHHISPVGNWVSKDDKMLVVTQRACETWGATREIYRRKAKPFVFPETAGSIIGGTNKVSRGRFDFILSEGSWVKINNRLSDSPYTEDQLRHYYTDFEVVFDRASVNI